jgi:fucose 4-O-acetylase-like acetyltransferase
MDPLRLRSQGIIAIFLTIPVIFIGGGLAQVPFSVGIVGPGLVFLVAGRALRRKLNEINSHRILFVSAGVLSFCAVVSLSGWIKPIDLKNGDLGDPIRSMVLSLLISCALVALFANLNLRAERWGMVTILGAASLVAVLTHAAILWVMSTPPSGGAIDFTLALLGSFAIGLIVLRTPLAPYLAGNSGR